MLGIDIDKPLVFFDLETTGANAQNDRIVEISIIKISPSGEREVKTRRINPEMHIPREASAIHGITDADVADAPTFRAISKNLYIYLEACDLGGYNITRFDIPVLINEFRRAGLEFSIEGRRIIDPYVIFCQMEPRTLVAAYKLFCGKELEGAHGAEADALASLEVFSAQLERYSELPRDITGLHSFCNPSNPEWVDASGRFRWQEGEVIVGFGQNSGILLRQIAATNPGFLKWIMRADFPADVKKIASDALKGEFPARPDVPTDPNGTESSEIQE